MSGQGYNEEEQKQLARAFETADRIISLTPAALSGSGEGRPPVYDFTKTPEENKALREKYDDWWKNATPFERLNQIKSGVEWTDRKPLPYARINPLSDFGREAMQKQQAEWEAGPFAGLSDLEAAIKLLEMDESEFFQLPESVQETALINYILQVKQSENYWTNFSANFSDSEKVNAFANAFVNEYILGGAVDKLMRLFNGGPTDRQLQADFLALRYPYQTGAGKVAAWFVPGLNTAAAGKLEALFTPLAGKVSDKMMRKLSGLWNMSPEALAQSKWRSALLKGGEKALTRGLASGAADLTLGTAQSLISGSSLSDALRDGIRSGQWGLYGGVAAGAVAGAIEGFRLSELAQAYHKAGGDFMWGDVTNWFRIGPYYDEYLMRGGDAAYGSFDAYLMFERLDDLYGELGGNQVWGSKDDFAEKVFVEADWLRYSSADAPTVLKYVPTSGVSLKSTPGKTTTILGRFNTDTYSIIQELHLSKSLDFSGNLGGFNLLNVPDGCYLSAEQFWNEFNKPFLDAAIRRGDVILMATPISLDNLYLPGTTDLTGYGREYFYLLENGYTYLDGKMILE